MKFYSEVLGWYVIMKPTTVIEDTSPAGIMRTDVFGGGWGTFKISHLAPGDSVGVDIFESKNTKRPENDFEYWKPASSTSASRTPTSRA